MIADGAPITEVQHRLGHASPAITLQVYSHFFKQTESDTSAKLADDILNGLPVETETEKSGHSVGTQGRVQVAAIGVSA